MAQSIPTTDTCPVTSQMRNIHAGRAKAEYHIQCTDRLSVAARKTEDNLFVVIQKDKVKLTMSLDEWNVIAVNKDSIDLGLHLLNGTLGLSNIYPS